MVKRRATLFLALVNIAVLLLSCVPAVLGGGASSTSPVGGTGPVLGGAWSTYPPTYTAYWGDVTYTGWQAQVVNYLIAQFPGAMGTTYPSHNAVGKGISVDLWTADAVKVASADNRGVQSMTDLAELIAAHLDQLGIRYVLWNRHSHYGDGWVDFGEQGNNNDNHYSHVHITFDDAPPATVIAQMDGGRVTARAVRHSVVVIRGKEQVV